MKSIVIYESLANAPRGELRKAILKELELNRISFSTDPYTTDIVINDYVISVVNDINNIQHLRKMEFAKILVNIPKKLLDRFKDKDHMTFDSFKDTVNGVVRFIKKASYCIIVNEYSYMTGGIIGKIDPNEIKQAINNVYGPSRSSAIKKVIFNDPATIVIWTDGTKTIVKCDGEKFDKEKGLAMAICKKLLGTNSSGSNYYEVFKKWIPEEAIKDIIIPKSLAKELSDGIYIIAETAAKAMENQGMKILAMNVENTDVD